MSLAGARGGDGWRGARGAWRGRVARVRGAGAGAWRVARGAWRVARGAGAGGAETRRRRNPKGGAEPEPPKYFVLFCSVLNLWIQNRAEQSRTDRTEQNNTHTKD